MFNLGQRRFLLVSRAAYAVQLRFSKLFTRIVVTRKRINIF
jgi:hypothetical protein